MRDDFCALILTHGRPDKVHTYFSLRRHGYTGKIYLVVDDEDKTLPRYQENFGEENVLVFSKAEIAKTMDAGDNFARKSVVFARNATYDLARQVGCTYFLELDDDYSSFHFKFNENFEFGHWGMKDMDAIIDIMIEFYDASGCSTIAMAQGGDFIGGENGSYGSKVKLTRKAMNSFLCSTKKPFQFCGQLNDDVNTYTTLGRKGELLLTINMVGLQQKETQQNSGGLTELYLDMGTYVKSFYTVMYEPSCCVVTDFSTKHRRLHHRLKWDSVCPKIIREEHKRAT